MLSRFYREEASKLAANPEVSHRIASLRQAIQEALVTKAVWTKERLITKAEISYDGAIEAKQYSAANGALKLIGETAGLLEPQSRLPVAVTKVTVILHPGIQRKVVEAQGRIVPEAE